MKSIKMCLSVVLLAGVALIQGCATGPGIFNGLGDDPMSMLIITRTDGQVPTYEQYLAVQTLAEEMHIQIEWQISSPVESGGTGGGAYGVAGAVGGRTYAGVYEGMLIGPAVTAQAVAYGAGGVITGLVTHSYSVDYNVGDATEKALRDNEADKKRFLDGDGKSILHNLHAHASFVRSRNNRNSPAPGLAEQMPAFSGAAAGTTVR